jgi:hypothetical protein
MQLVADELHVRALGTQLAPRFAQHRLAKAVVLADEVHALHASIIADDLHQSGHAHVGVGVESEVPEAAFLIGQDRVHRRVVEEQHTPAGFALVVLVERVDQHGGH